MADRSIGFGSMLFFFSIVMFISAHYVKDESVSEGLYTVGSVCCTLLVVFLLCRCCCICCMAACPDQQDSSGYRIVIDGADTSVNVQNVRINGTILVNGQRVYPPNVPNNPSNAGNPVGATAPPDFDPPPSYADATGGMKK